MPASLINTSDMSNTCALSVISAPGQGSPGSAHPTAGASQRGWEEAGRPALLEVPGGSSPLQDRVHTLAEAERLFDELTQEKLQVGGSVRVQCAVW